MEEDQKLNVRLVGRDGRRWYDPASKARLVAACHKPGVSVSRLALEHGINANLLRKWVKAAQENETVPSSSTPAFVPVLAVDSNPPMPSRPMMEVPPTLGEQRLAKLERTESLPSPAKVSAALPNGVKLTLECGDTNALSAIIGALCDVQTGR
ncbi:MAG: transposase [Henriciella sp.]|jgi:transposase